ncbi:unnamed protein product [Cuscuta europaea]|uniref:PB1-like domain-containing protein n=1 Tax=Cuscuta europaea TaxID=41803 RepID=A0A9P0Z5V9_CUSEU|nr:unnamed protein product [Cuscuta europaea]
MFHSQIQIICLNLKYFSENERFVGRGTRLLKVSFPFDGPSCDGGRMTSRRLNGLNVTLKQTKDERHTYTIKMYYAGDLVHEPVVQYKNGRVEYFDYFNGEEASILELRKLVKKLRFCSKKDIFWLKYGSGKFPSVRRIKTYEDIYNIFYELPENREMSWKRWMTIMMTSA